MLLQETAEKQLAPISELVKACQKRKPCPDFGTLRSWAQAAQAARRPATGHGTSAAHQDMEARIEVNLEGMSDGGFTLGHKSGMGDLSSHARTHPMSLSALPISTFFSAAAVWKEAEVQGQGWKPVELSGKAGCQ